MSKNANNDPNFKFYRSYLNHTISKRALKRERDAFIRQHFRPEVSFSFWFIPSLAAACLAGFLVLKSFVAYSPSPMQESLEQPVVFVQQEAPQSVEGLHPYPVEIKRLKSDTGVPLLYQRFNQDIPMTVIWIFPKGEVL